MLLFWVDCFYFILNCVCFGYVFMLLCFSFSFFFVVFVFILPPLFWKSVSVYTGSSQIQEMTNVDVKP